MAMVMTLLFSSSRALAIRVFHCAVALALRLALFCILLNGMPIRTAVAYDNASSPPFAADKVGRAYNAVSIHRDGEQWLISECLRAENTKPLDCQLFVYKIRSNRYQRFQLPIEYIYTDAKFSPSGRWIVGVRRPQPKADTYDELIRTFGNSEIFMMKLDGSSFNIPAVPKGHLKLPSLSEDDTKFVYWKSSKKRSAKEKTTFADFDVYEFDLMKGIDELFAGSFHFFLVRGLQYVGHDKVVISAYGPSQYAEQIGKYRERFNSSEVYFINRGQKDLPDPLFTEISGASDITVDLAKNFYLLGTHRQHGLSIFRFSSQPAHWRIPRLVPGGISALFAAPGGRHIGFVYPVNSARSGNPTNSLGIFDLSEEQWVPVYLPSPESAEICPSNE